MSLSGSKKHSKPSMCSSELVSRVEAVQIQLEEETKRRMEVEKQIQDFILQRGGPQAAAVAKILKEGDLANNNNKTGSNLSVRSSGNKSNNNENAVIENGSNRGSVRSVASSASSSKNQQVASYGRQLILPPMNGASGNNNNNHNQLPIASSFSTSNQHQQYQSSVPQPPTRRDSNSVETKKRPVLLTDDEDIVVKCEREAAECDKLIRQLNHSHASVLSRKPQLPQVARGISKKNTAQTGAVACDYVMARRSKATPAQLYMMNQWHQERMDKINNFTFGIAGGGAY